VDTCTLLLIIPVTRRVKGYTRFVGKYVTGRRKHFRPHKLYIFLIRITSRVDLAMSVCPFVRMNAEISETIRARLLGFGMHLRSASLFQQGAPPTLTPTSRPKLRHLQFIILINTYRLTQKKVYHAHKLQKIVSMNADISETRKDGELGFQT